MEESNDRLFLHRQFYDAAHQLVLKSFQIGMDRNPLGFTIEILQQQCAVEGNNLESIVLERSALQFWDPLPCQFLLLLIGRCHWTTQKSLHRVGLRYFSRRFLLLHISLDEAVGIPDLNLHLRSGSTGCPLKLIEIIDGITAQILQTGRHLVADPVLDGDRFLETGQNLAGFGTDGMDTGPGQINTAIKSEWMGFRPSMPDSTPVISRSPRHANAFFAFGHGHLGLTLGATTGRLVADLMASGEAPVDMTPYRINRF